MLAIMSQVMRCLPYLLQFVSFFSELRPVFTILEATKHSQGRICSCEGPGVVKMSKPVSVTINLKK
jgi:hypothetical protein